MLQKRYGRNHVSALTTVAFYNIFADTIAHKDHGQLI